MSTSLTIADVAVRQDSAGRYCLNDLHRAAGGDAKHQPAMFLRLDMTQALAAEIENSADVQSSRAVVSKGGRNGGTFVAKELVYAYAMWISPAFNLKVIRAYDAMVNGQINWHRMRHEAASSCKVMHAVLQGVREKAGKPTAAHHYINEARLVNWALAGEFVGINRDTLTGDDLDLLAKLEERNAVLIGMAMPYADRKSELSTYAAELRNTRQLRLGEAA